MVLFAVVRKMKTLRYSVNIVLSEKKQSIATFVFVVPGGAATYGVYSSDGDGGGGGEELVVMCWRGATASLSFPP